MLISVERFRFFYIMTKSIRFIITCLILVCNFNIISAQKSSNFSLYSLGIEAPPQNYEGFVWNDYDDATNFFIKYINENQNDKALQFLNAGAKPFPNYFYSDKWIVYKLIDQKNYTILDAIHKKYPLMFKYSQALHYACAMSDSTMIDYLISKGASLNLNGCCLDGNKPAYKWNADQRWRMLPIDCAMGYNANNYNFLIKKYKTSPSANRVSILVKLFIDKNIPSAVYSLMNNSSFDPNVRASELEYFSDKAWSDKNIILLEYAIRKGQKDIAKKLIEMGADVNASKGSNSGLVCPLKTAVTMPDMQDIIELLLSKGAKTKMPYQYSTENIINKARSEYKEWFILNGYQ